MLLSFLTQSELAKMLLEMCNQFSHISNGANLIQKLARSIPPERLRILPLPPLIQFLPHLHCNNISYTIHNTYWPGNYYLKGLPFFPGPQMEIPQIVIFNDTF